VGFTNDVTVAVWAGYDNADGKRRTLGPGQTGAKVAVPIFEPIIQAAWTHHAPKTALAPPSPEARRQLAALPIDLVSGDRLPPGTRGGFVEQFRVDRGELVDTQHRLVSREQTYAYRGGEVVGDGETFGGWWSERDSGPFSRFPSWREQPQTPWSGLFGQPRWYGDERSRPRRIDPDYFWGNRHLVQ
jgi:penicillin-binding protein 1A